MRQSRQLKNEGKEEKQETGKITYCKLSTMEQIAHTTAHVHTSKLLAAMCMNLGVRRNCKLQHNSGLGPIVSAAVQQCGRHYSIHMELKTPRTLSFFSVSLFVLLLTFTSYSSLQLELTAHFGDNPH